MLNNPLIPGDPYSYDLKWLVAKVKEILAQLGTLDEAIEAKIFEGFLEHSIVQFKSVPEMLAADITDGSIVLTLGYHEAGDQGGLFYLVKDFNPDQCALDYFLTLDNNKQIAIPVIVTPYVTPEMYGAYGDGSTDDNEAFTLALASGKPVRLQTKTYKIDGGLTMPRNTTMEGSTHAWYNTPDNCILDLTAPLQLNETCQVNNFTIHSTGDGLELLGGRTYVKDISIVAAGNGISIGAYNTNLAYFENVSIVNADTGIKITNGNSYNSQGMSFKDIDIRQCRVGMDSAQPGNRFYNFCVQNCTEYGIILQAGADNNAFYGTYLENENAVADVDFGGSKFNYMTGPRPVHYSYKYINNTGHNTFSARSPQNGDALFKMGLYPFEAVGVISAEAYNGPSAYVKMAKSANNKVRMTVEGTSSDTLMGSDVIPDLSDITFRNVDGTKIQHVGFTMQTYTPTSFPQGGRISWTTTLPFTARYFGIASCNKEGVIVTLTPSGTNMYRITCNNRFGGDLSNTELEIYLLVGNKP